MCKPFSTSQVSMDIQSPKEKKNAANSNKAQKQIGEYVGCPKGLSSHAVSPI
jgi:hypothetical protein